TSYLDECRGRRTVEKAGLAAARAAATTAAEQEAVDRISAGLDAFNGSLDGEFALSTTNRAGALAISTGRNRGLRKAYEKNFDAAITMAKEQVAAASAGGDRQAGRTRVILFALLGVMLVAGVT